MSASYRSVLLGELLLRAGLISEHQLKEALLRAKETQLPVGKLLVLADAVTQEELHEAVDVQSLVHDKILEFEEGARRLAGLRQSAGEPVVVDSIAALHEASPRNLIGQLLLDSGLIDGPQLAQAFPVHRDTGLPLGRVLVYTAGLNSAHLSAAILTQVMVRSGRLSRERAVSLLKSIKDDSAAGDAMLSAVSLDEERSLLMRKLLLGARLVREAPMLIALEVAIAEAQPLDAVLVQSALCTAKTVEVASQLCEQLQQGKITNVAAVQKLQEAAGGEPNGKVHSLMQFSPSDLLRLSRIVSDADVKLVAPQLDLKPAQPHSDVVPDLALCAALECHGLLERGVITAERAIIALYLCLNKGLPLDQVLEQLAPETTEMSVL